MVVVARVAPKRKSWSAGRDRGICGWTTVTGSQPRVPGRPMGTKTSGVLLLPVGLSAVPSPGMLRVVRGSHRR